MLCKFWIQLLVAVSLLTVSYGQVSFSTNWGSGKRSSDTAPLVNDICLAKTDTKLLYDLMRVIQRQAERIIACSSNYDELKRTF
ncbi:adipokinetic prohormone type 2-like [Saccostrea cucullata]|uniref:adipokinetic prohormone type 2-like n=1 Tax=Saccostrea cuccullata TaxID=36930 RepID=UPI002ED2303F